MPVAGQQDAAFPHGAGDQVAVLGPVLGDHGVMTGGAQPPPEAAQHLVAQETHPGPFLLLSLALYREGCGGLGRVKPARARQDRPTRPWDCPRRIAAGVTPGPQLSVRERGCPAASAMAGSGPFRNSL